MEAKDKCTHDVKDLTLCQHCETKFCGVCLPCHKLLIIRNVTTEGSHFIHESPSVLLGSKLQSAERFLDDDLMLIKQQIGSTIDAIVEQFTNNLHAEGSKLLCQAEDAIDKEKNRLKQLLTRIDMEKLDNKNNNLRLKMKEIEDSELVTLSLDDLVRVNNDVKEMDKTITEVEHSLGLSNRMRVSFDMDPKLEERLKKLEDFKLGSISLSHTPHCLLKSFGERQSSTDCSYNKVSLMSVFHGEDAFGDTIYLPHALAALPGSNRIVVLHGESRLSVLACTTAGIINVQGTYHVFHPNNTRIRIPLHNIVSSNGKVYMIGDACKILLLSMDIENQLSSCEKNDVVPNIFAKAWSDRGFRGLAIGYKHNWLFTADGDSISAYSLDSATPTFRRIASFPSSFEPIVHGIFPDGITLVYSSTKNPRKLFWREFPVGEDSRKRTDLLDTSRVYENQREVDFGACTVDSSGNLILCDDRSLQIFYRYAVDVPVSSFPLPLPHDELAPNAHSVDAHGMAVLSCGTRRTSFNESHVPVDEMFHEIVVVSDTKAHRLMAFKISG